ncbi:O-methyltransferase [Polaribacter ponticola]|uniref:Class I SAM-dependent methyltransferase n=1 Tax=Polaribacter ponticola TaxID=2978475 RepID=A0ABT5S599_9FLAO|nr:class I SAM-dependent methyltransferase [Polaribacter sp. MSW5]MDD7913282.1 class I SAM-dependent methyltransferase [Polaribacter sp. MSW5]
MHTQQITNTIADLYTDAKYDKLKMIKGVAKSAFRPLQPKDFEEAYLPISNKQGIELVQLIKQNNFKNIVEFGTSFGISTLFLAQGILETNGHVITTELLESKAQIAKENFKKAGVENLIDVRIGDALETLKNHSEPIDLFLLDGWMNLYQPLFEMLEPNFHKNSIIYVDNANMVDSKKILASISKEKYQIELTFNSKVAIIKL